MSSCPTPPGQGRCRLRPELNIIPPSLRCCEKYVERGTGARAKKKKRAVHGRARPLKDVDVVIERAAQAQASRPKAYGPTLDLEGTDMDTEALKALIRDVLIEESTLGETEIGARWAGGTAVLKPASDTHQAKEIPLDQFFQKLVMVRDRLRVLEQKINGHKSLSAAEKLDFQQYITRAYGSLTTFNVLFRDKADQFVGSKSG